METIDRAIVFCTELDPAFPDELEGCEADDIEELRQEVSRPLVPGHHRFLQRMGEARGWLDFGPCDMSAYAVATAVRRTKGTAPETLDLIGLGQDDPTVDMYLRHADGAILVHPSITGFKWSLLREERFRRVADSLAQLICVHALLSRFLEVAPLHRQVALERHEPEFLTEVDELFAGLGFEPLWFSGSTTRVARRKSIRIMARQYPGIAGMIFIAAEIEDGEEYAEALLGIERYIERHEPPSGEPNLS